MCVLFILNLIFFFLLPLASRFKLLLKTEKPHSVEANRQTQGPKEKQGL